MKKLKVRQFRAESYTLKNPEARLYVACSICVWITSVSSPVPERCFVQSRHWLAVDWAAGAAWAVWSLHPAVWPNQVLCQKVKSQVALRRALLKPLLCPRLAVASQYIIAPASFFINIYRKSHPLRISGTASTGSRLVFKVSSTNSIQLVVLSSNRKMLLQTNSFQDIDQPSVLGAKCIRNTWVFNTKHLLNKDLSGVFFEAGTLPSPGDTTVDDTPSWP